VEAVEVWLELLAVRLGLSSRSGYVCVWPIRCDPSVLVEFEVAETWLSRVGMSGWNSRRCDRLEAC
jgi:hypothetical protein